MFLKLRGGTATLTDRLAERLGPDVVRTGTRATAIEQPAGGGFEVAVADGARLPADAVIVATPALRGGRPASRRSPPPAAADLARHPVRLDRRASCSCTRRARAAAAGRHRVRACRAAARP